MIRITERRHPSEDLLVGFATGGLAAVPAIVVSAHVEGCETCRERVGVFEEIEGQLMASLAPAEMSPDAVNCALARLDAEPPPTTAGDSDPHLADVRLPQSVADAGVGSRRWLAPGLWAAPVGRWRREDGWRLFLLRAPTGTAIPTHRHRGGELIAVLSGAFRDRERFQAGDFAENLAGADHNLRVEDGPCACLIAMQGQVGWRGWARMITPVLGI